MFINEVETKVGLSKKSIRYYEENNLLTPKRDEENGYRIYSEEDIKKLKTIKFLRELNVPIRELKLLNENKMTLKECMEDRIKKIKEQESNYQKIKEMCEEIIKNNEAYHNIDINNYFLEINILNKKGFTMKDIIQNKSKKIFGAVLSSFIFILLFATIITTISYFQITESEKLPWIIYGIIIFILTLPIFGTIYNLIERIQEIKKGEEDEASKY